MRVDRARRLACERRGPRGTTWRRLSRGHGLGGGDDDGSAGGDRVCGVFMHCCGDRLEACMILVDLYISFSSRHSSLMSR
jgi:hypothetical protein